MTEEFTPTAHHAAYQRALEWVAAHLEDSWRTLPLMEQLRYEPESRPVPTELTEAFDGDIAHLLYSCLVMQGAQLPVAEIWPVRDARAAVAAHFYASTPPQSGL